MHYYRTIQSLNNLVRFYFRTKPNKKTNKMKLPKIKKINQIIGYRLVKSGEVIEANDLYCTSDPAGVVDSGLLETINIHPNYEVGQKWSSKHYFGNFLYRKSI